MARILTLCGSPLPGSRAGLLAAHLSQRLALQGHALDRLEVSELPAEVMFHARFEAPEVRQLAERVAAAQGLVIVSPVYKAAYTGALKVVLDLLPQYALEDKAVLPLMVGGSAAHLLAIDTALRPVLCSMGARFVAQGVYFTDAQLTRAEDDTLAIDPAVEPRLEAAVRAFVEGVRTQHS